MAGILMLMTMSGTAWRCRAAGGVALPSRVRVLVLPWGMGPEDQWIRCFWSYRRVETWGCSMSERIALQCIHSDCIATLHRWHQEAVCCWLEVTRVHWQPTTHTVP